MTAENLATPVVLDGLTIRAGNADEPSPPGFLRLADDRGSGAGVYATNSELTIVDCTIRDNRTIDHGAGVHSENGTLALQTSTIRGNIAQKRGAGIHVVGGVLSIHDATFELNTATSYGGGLYVDGGSPTIGDGTTFESNVASNGGGAYLVNVSEAAVSDSVFQNNEAVGGAGSGTTAHGGGLYIAESGVTLTGCSFGGSDPSLANVASMDGGGLYAVNTGVTLSGCMFQQNKSSTGGGLAARGTALDATGCTFVGNQPGPQNGAGGGGISLASASSATLTDCAFSNNNASVGGAVYVGGASSLRLSGSSTASTCLLSGNSSSGSGGAIYLHIASDAGTEETPGISYCAFVDNSAGGSGNGGAIYATGSNAVIDHSTFEGCSAAGGGAIAVTGGSPGSVEALYSTFDENSANYGGAIYATGVNDFLVQGCTLSNNTVVQQGGAVWIGSMSQYAFTIRDSLIRANSGGEGGGVFVSEPFAWIIDSTVAENQSTGHGGGIRTEASGHLALLRSQVVQNTSGFDGGGIYVYDCGNPGNFCANCLFTPHAVTWVLDSLIANNEANAPVGGRGGGIFQLSGNLNIGNSTIVDNHAAHRGGGLWGDYCLISTIYNSIFWGNEADDADDPLHPAGDQLRAAGYTEFTRSDVQGGEVAIDRCYDGICSSETIGDVAWGSDSFDADPGFVDPDGPDDLLRGQPNAWADNNYRLRITNPTLCVDGGNTDIIRDTLVNSPDGLDLALQTRIQGCNVDLGAYEQSAPPAAVITDSFKRNRYLRIEPGNAGRVTALRVTFVERVVDGLHYFGGAEGQSWWVGPPSTVADVGGNPDFHAAPLQCTPYHTDWGALGTVQNPATVYVYGPEIVPDASYTVESIAQVCDPALTEGFSTPVTVTTAKWGDVNTDYTRVPPNVVVNFQDVSAIIAGFQGKPTALSKTRLDLYPRETDPTSNLNFQDVSQCVDVFMGRPYPFSGPGAACPALTPGPMCSGGVLADFNLDGVIDFTDMLVGATDSLSLSINEDDDNDNLVEDYLDNGPVDGENDLTELRLGITCTDFSAGTAWWRVAWTDLNPNDPPLAIWLTPDKSDGNGGLGVPLVNGSETAWPPPESLWLEARRQYDSIGITVTFSDGAAAIFSAAVPASREGALNPAQRAGIAASVHPTAHSHAGYDIYEALHGTPQDARSDRLAYSALPSPDWVVESAPSRQAEIFDFSFDTRAFCTRPPGGDATLRYWTIAEQQTPVTGVSAVITDRSVEPLCAERYSTAFALLRGLSLAWTSVSRDVNTPENSYKIYAQVGYGREKPKWGIPFTSRYAETVWGPDVDRNRDFFFKEDLGSGSLHKYAAYQNSALLGEWVYEIDDLPFHAFAHPAWKNLEGQYARWCTELYYLQDKRVGEPDSHCIFTNLGISKNFAGRGDDLAANVLNDAGHFHPEPRGNRSEWGMLWISPVKFEIWDKKP